MRELVEYNRRMDLWRSNGAADPAAVPDASMCKYVELHTFQRPGSKHYETFLKRQKEKEDAKAAALAAAAQ